MIRILLADDHPLTRAGLVAWLEGESGIELVGEADDGESAWKKILELAPDLVLMDIEMPNGNGIEIAARVLREKLPTAVLMLTAYSGEEYAIASLRAGAKGFVLKSAPLEQLRRAIFDVASGVFYLDPSVSIAWECEPYEALSPREKEVLLLASEGLPAYEIASRLVIAERTVTAHLTSIYGKLGAKNKTEAILIALKRGVILLSELRFQAGE